jgi:putative peptidoglycan lipid II flippase
MTVGLIALADPIVNIILEHGSFDSVSGDLTARTLIAFAAGLPAFSVYLYVMRGFYALRDTRTPFIINLGENTANVVLGLLLVDRYGVVGLAASFSIAYALFAIVAMIALQRRIGGIFDRRTTQALLRQFAATVVMVFTVAIIANTVQLGALAEILVVGALSVGVYLGTLLLLRSEETELVISRLRGRRSDRN